jgi:hypothetical protein
MSHEEVRTRREDQCLREHVMMSEIERSWYE